MKKLLVLLTVCGLLTSCSSAGTKADPDSMPATSESSVAEEVSGQNDADEIKQKLLQATDCYRKESVTMPDDIMYISYAFQTGNGKIFLQTDSPDYQNGYYLTDENFSEFTPFEYEMPEEVTAYDDKYENISFNNDGSFNIMFTLIDHNGIIAPEVYDENFDYESYEENSDTSYMICTYDKDGKLLTKAVFEYPDDAFNDDYGYLECGMPVADGDSFLQGFGDGSIHRITSTGEFQTVYTIENPDEYAYTSSPQLWKDRDGKIIAVMHENKKSFDANGYEGIESKVIFRELDNGKIGDTIYSCNEYELNGAVSFGTGEYRIYIPLHSQVTGIKDDGTAEKVIDWQKSSLDPVDVIIPIADNNFIGNIYNSNDKIIKLVPRDMSELENVQIITVSNCTGTIVNDFNNSQTKYRVESIDYPYDDNNEKLNLDIISGNAPDVICGMNYSTYLNYCKKGLFVDLCELMDDELNKDKLMPNVVTAFESGGKMFGLCDKFRVNTMVVKSKFCNKENWTFDDMLDLYDNAPDYVNHLYDGESKLDMFKTMFYTMNDLIDYENATCDFNNAEFIKMLEFCNRFVDTVDAPQKWDDPEAWSKYNAEKYHWIGNDNTFIAEVSFFHISAYNLVKYTQSNGEDLTLVGYPSNNGKGGRISPETIMSINSQCEDKQGAWEFLKYYTLKSNEVDKNNENSYTEFMPVVKESFADLFELDKKQQHSAGSTEYPSYTDDEAKMISDYIMSCDSIGTVLDEDIVSICEEEAGLYFAGEQTAETAAEHIQNRVSILVSERK